MTDLDNQKSIRRYDTCSMLELIESFPEQCSGARAIGERFAAPRAWVGRHRRVVFTGLGGSAIGSDILRSYVADVAYTPLFVNRNYTMPAFVDKSTLVIASSYSGNTEETLSAYIDARRRGAAVIAITSGGKLAEYAGKDGTPFIRIPSGLPPRCALGYSFFPLLMILSKLGIIPGRSKEIDGAIKTLGALRTSKLGQRVDRSRNISKSIAYEIYGRCPFIYGSQDHIDAVVARWRAQIEENAKTIASCHVLPEMDHNEIVGWVHPKSVLERSTALFLRDADDHPRISKRIDITQRLLKGAGMKTVELRSTGTGLLARIFSLIYTGDFVSFYLAILNRVDPTPVDRIARLKRELGGVMI